MDVNIDYDSGGVVILRGISGKCSLVRVIGHSYPFFALWVQRTQYGLYERPRQFLDEDDVKSILHFKNDVDDEVVLTNVLRENFDILRNYAWMSFTAEWINYFLFLQSSWYFLVCHS